MTTPVVLAITNPFSVLTFRFVTILLVVTHFATQSISLAAAEADYPQAWLEPAKTASELGIVEFEQSPILNGKDLPAVPRGLQQGRVQLY